jgi:hypothetical protein
MTTIIYEAGIAKPFDNSLEDRARLLTNERARVQRRLKVAQAKFVGLCALKDVLPRYLQSGDYEHLHDLLQRDLKRWKEAYLEIEQQASDARFDAKVGKFGRRAEIRDEVGEIIHRTGSKV